MAGIPLPCLPSFSFVSHQPSGPLSASGDSGRPFPSPSQKGPRIIPGRRVEATLGLVRGRVKTQPCRWSSGLRSLQSPAPPPISLAWWLHAAELPGSPCSALARVCSGVEWGSRKNQCTETRTGFHQQVELGCAVPEGKDKGLSPGAPLGTGTV